MTRVRNTGLDVKTIDDHECACLWGKKKTCDPKGCERTKELGK